MAENRIQIVITTDASGALTGIRQVGEETKNFGQSVEKTGNSVDRASQQMTGLSSSLSFAQGQFPGLIAGATAFVGALSVEQAIKFGMAYETAIARLRGVFQDQGEEAIQAAQNMAAQMNHFFSFTEIAKGMARIEDLMANYKIPFQQQQALMEAAAAMSKVKGYELEETLQRLALAISGAARGAKGLGLVLGDSFMQYQAFNGALKDVWTGLDDTTKANLRVQEVLIQSRKYMGALETDAATLGGALKSLANTLSDSLGGSLASVNGYLATFVNLMNRALQMPKIDDEIIRLQKAIEQSEKPFYARSDGLDFLQKGAMGAHGNFIPGIDAEGRRQMEQSTEDMRKYLELLKQYKALGSGVEGNKEFIGPPKPPELNFKNDGAQALVDASMTARQIWNRNVQTLWISANKGTITDEQYAQAAAHQDDILQKALQKDQGSPGGAGRSPIDENQISQKIFQIKQSYEKMYSELTNESYNFWILQAQNEGRFYDADALKVDQWVQHTTAKYAQQIAAEEQRVTMLKAQQDKSQGMTQGAKDLIDAELIEREKNISAIQRQLGLLKEEAAQKTITDEHQHALGIAQVNVQYYQLTGTMEQQLRANLALIEATAQQKLGYDWQIGKLDQLGQAYKRLYLEQQRIAQLQISGTLSQGFFEQARIIGSQLPTAYQTGAQYANELKSSIHDLSTTIGDFISKGKLDVSSWATSMISHLIAVRMEALLTQAVFGNGSMGSGLAGWIGGLFRMSGGPQSYTALPTEPWSPFMMGGGAGGAGAAASSSARSGAGAGRWASKEVHVHIDNQSGMPLKLEQGPTSDQFDKYIVNVVAKNIVEYGDLGKLFYQRRG